MAFSNFKNWLYVYILLLTRFVEIFRLKLVDLKETDENGANAWHEEIICKYMENAQKLFRTEW